MATMENLPKLVSREEGLAARKRLLRKERELSRVHPGERRAARVADGPHRQAVHIRRPERDSRPARHVRGLPTAGDGPLHADG
jgi:hypothetical protein